MNAIIDGVSWFDNHARFPLIVPYIDLAPEEVGVHD